MRKETAMGLERELGWVCTIPGETNNDPAHFPEFARQEHKFDPVDGSRSYIDCGHYEVTTSECMNPWELVKHSKAIDNRIFGPWANGYFVKSNSVGGGGCTESFGSHENYSCENIYNILLGEETPEIIALGNLLISRNYFSGDGGMDPLNRVPVISRRLCHTTSFKDSSTTNLLSKPLINTKNESHGNSERFHVICGGDNMSDWSMLLKFGITALGIRLVSTGRFPQPTNNLYPSMQDSNKVLFPIGRHPWLVEQEMWYEMCINNIDVLPTWAEDFLVIWKSFIDMPAEELSKKIDWQIKYKLFRATLKLKNIDSPGTNDWKRHFSALESCSFLYGKMASDGGFFKLRDKLQCTIERCNHSAHRIEPTGGRARTRAKIIRFVEGVATFSTSWDKINCTVDDKSFSISLPDPTSEACIITAGNTVHTAKSAEQAIEIVGKLCRNGVTLPARSTVSESDYRSISEIIGLNENATTTASWEYTVTQNNNTYPTQPSLLAYSTERCDIEREVDRIIQTATNNMQRTISDSQRGVIARAIASYDEERRRRHGTR